MLQGFTVRNGQKGVMADEVTDSVIRGLTVTDTGDETIHLRKFSTDNLVLGNTMNKSDRNEIAGNTISRHDVGERGHQRSARPTAFFATTASTVPVSRKLIPGSR